jgi:hypothetical protein
MVSKHKTLIAVISKPSATSLLQIQLVDGVKKVVLISIENLKQQLENLGG